MKLCLLVIIIMKPLEPNEFPLSIRPVQSRGRSNEAWEKGSSSSALTMHGAALLSNHHNQSRQVSSKSGIFQAV